MNNIQTCRDPIRTEHKKKLSKVSVKKIFFTLGSDRRLNGKMAMKPRKVPEGLSTRRQRKIVCRKPRR